jgi:hypothetical protein
MRVRDREFMVARHGSELGGVVHVAAVTHDSTSTERHQMGVRARECIASHQACILVANLHGVVVHVAAVAHDSTD